jgi:hypothetical protein
LGGLLRVNKKNEYLGFLRAVLDLVMANLPGCVSGLGGGYGWFGGGSGFNGWPDSFHPV